MTIKKVLVLLICLSMAILTSCKNDAYVQLLAQALEIDNNICKYAQALIGDIDNSSGITVSPVSPGSEFTSTKATVDNSTNTALPVYTTTLGTSDFIFGSEIINTTIWCKTRIPEAIKWRTGIDYTDNDTAAATCKEINEYIYNMTLELLTEEQKEKYNNEGKQIVFTDDTIVGEGIEFYALDQYSLITDADTHLNISSASLESAFDSSNPEDDRRGAKYCKIISAQNFLTWMLDGSFKNSGNLTKSDPTLLTCEDVNNSAGSCYFINEHSKTYMCEDYIGPIFQDIEFPEYKDPEAKCINDRAGTYVDGVTCADREDIEGTISGICAINETEDGAYTWTMYEPEGEDECPLRFFNCNEQ